MPRDDDTASGARTVTAPERPRPPRGGRTRNATAAPPPAGAWLFAVVFLAGAALMAYEIVGSRLLAPYFGNSTYVWGSLIGVFLGALASGYAIGGRLADRFPTPGALAVVLDLAALLVLATVLLGDPIQELIVDHDLGIKLNSLVASIALFAPASILMGMVSPWAVRLKASTVEGMGRTAGSLYGLSTAGSIAGTLAAAFWLVETAGSERTVLLVAATLAGCALLIAVATRVRPGSMAFAVATLFVLVIALGSIGSINDEQTYRGVGTGFSPVFRSGGYRAEYQASGSGDQVEAVDSRYHRIRVVDYPDGALGGIRGSTRVMHFDNSLQAAVALDTRGAPVTDGPPVFTYQRAFDLLPVIVPDARRMLFIGLGSGAAPMRMHQLRPDIEIDVVEIDPEVVRLARRHFGYVDGKRSKGAVETHVGDGRSWLAASDATYDAIVVDAYFADSIPFHLTTREFLQVVREHLADDGVVAANLIGALEGPRNELLRAMAKTWGGTFDDVVLYPVPVDGQLDERRYINVELFAAPRGVLPPTGAEGTMVEGAMFPARAGTVFDGALRDIVEARRSALDLSRKGVPTLTDDFAPVDSMLSVDGDPESGGIDGETDGGE